MKRVLTLTLALLLIVPTLPTRLAARTAARAADTPPLIDMLAHVPDQSALHGSDASDVGPRFVDFQALYTVEGIEEVRHGSFALLSKMVPLVAILNRIAIPPEALAYLFASMEQMPQTVGFQWIADVDRSLEFGAPPQTGTLLQGTFDPEAIGTALSARGFESTEFSGVTVWSRFEDGAFNVQDRDMSDPFGGQLGAAARIALLPDGYVANARFSAVTAAIVDAAQGTVPSLADDADYRALADAITAPDGLLLQAWFLQPATLAVTDPPADYGPLAPYTLAVLADREEGGDQVHLIGLVYPSADEAQAAADEVAQRFSTYSPPSYRNPVPLVEHYGAQVSQRVYDSPTTGNAVAVIELRYPLPTDRTDPDTGKFASSGQLYRMLANAVQRREFTPLEITAP